MKFSNLEAIIIGKSSERPGAAGNFPEWKSQIRPALCLILESAPTIQFRGTGKYLPSLVESAIEHLDASVLLFPGPNSKFHAITALEEASTALGSALIHCDLLERKQLKIRNHRDKEKISLLSRTLIDLIQEMISLGADVFENPRITIREGKAQLLFDLKGKGLTGSTRLSDYVVVREGQSFEDVIKESIERSTREHGQLSKAIDNAANTRNLCLYAGSRNSRKDRFERDSEILNFMLQTLYCFVVALDILQPGPKPASIKAFTSIITIK